MTASLIDTYRRQIERELQAGNATEHTHRPALKTLIESLAPGITATNEPKRVERGVPDFAVCKKAAHGPVTLGHIEAKDVGKDLGEVEKSEQMRRYLPALPNLILTDYLEFRWYEPPRNHPSLGSGRAHRRFQPLTGPLSRSTAILGKKAPRTDLKRASIGVSNSGLLKFNWA